MHLTEDLETLTEAVAGEKLPAEELSKLPQVNSQEETFFFLFFLFFYNFILTLTTLKILPT